HMAVSRLLPGKGQVATTRYQYNVDKELVRVTRPDGQEVGLEYDAGGRLSRTVIPRGVSHYTYDGAGRVQGVTAPDGGTLTYSYDGSLPRSVTWGGIINGTVAFTYDHEFRIIGETVNGGHAISLGYDLDGLLTSVGDLVITRDAGNGLLTGTTLGSITTRRTIDPFGATASFTAMHGATELLQTLYVRDALDRITQKIETVAGQRKVFDYRYDPAGRLVEVKQDGRIRASYAYDANGNRLSRVEGDTTEIGVYDEQDRLIAYGDAVYTHTANGELLAKSDSGGTTQYDYDVLGNLAGVTLPDGTRIEYLIDGANRRVGKRVNGGLVSGYLYANGVNPVAELDGSGNVVTRFVYGTRGNVPDYLVKGGQNYRIVSDHLGSPRLVVQMDTGEVVQRLDYDEYGRILEDTHPGFQPFGFAGGLYDPETGLIRFGARDYDPVTGRWTAKDPIRFLGGDTNLFGYVLGDPVNLTDPDGQNPVKHLLDIVKHSRNAYEKGKAIWKDLDFDGPSPGLEYGNGRVCQVRYKKHPVFRLDYQPIPGSGNESRLHVHTVPNINQHRSIDPRSLND
ncbi:MAG: RHS repeat-associated core domain-containing protein, partial [Magnetococcales bacterium]|nr:RHS repeat-associated core domain-containing protein [Magnetococcales bacterium]